MFMLSNTVSAVAHTCISPVPYPGPPTPPGVLLWNFPMHSSSQFYWTPVSLRLLLNEFPPWCHNDLEIGNNNNFHEHQYIREVLWKWIVRTWKSQSITAHPHHSQINHMSEFELESPTSLDCAVMWSSEETTQTSENMWTLYRIISIWEHCP